MNLWSTLGFYALLVIIGISGGAGDVFIYRWAKSNQLQWMVFGQLSWILCITLFGLAMRIGSRSLSVTFVVTALIHIAVVLGWDLFMQRTKISTIESVGLVLAVIGVVCLEVGGSPDTQSQ